MQCKWCEHEIFNQDFVTFERNKLHPQCRKEIVRLRKFQSIPKSPKYFDFGREGKPTHSALREFRKIIKIVNND